MSGFNFDGGIDYLDSCIGSDFSVEVVNVDGASCPLGYVCNATQMANCTHIWANAIENFKWGHVHDGIYCPENNTFLQFCEQSYYCPNPETKLPCPEGFFCPAKTKEPYIICTKCPEGSQAYRHNNALAIPFLIVFVVVVVGYITFDFARTYLQFLTARIESLSNRILQASEIEKHADARQARLNHLRPKFAIIQSRLHLEEGNSEALAIDSEGNVTFNEVEFFELVDKDKNGTITYDELDAILQLQPKELRQFVERMNELDHHENTDEISKKCFTHYFLDVLEECASFQLTPEEAGVLWDEMSKKSGVKKTGKVRLQTMYESSISNILSDTQISQVITKFRRSLEESTRSDNLRSSTSGRPSTEGIERDFFCNNYPKFLDEVQAESVENSTRVEGIDIAFRDLELAVNAGRNVTVNVVDNVTGRVQGGKMTAVMGGSGAGKTSLLNALCGRAYYGEVKGDVFINGHQASIEDFTGSIGFVPQDDIVFAELTVRENLMFSGRLRLPKGTPVYQIEALAETAMANLGLARKSSSLVGDVTRRGLSGGEKKRVNIGLELMARPAALFLDEPTSGLDSSSSLLVMNSLKQLSEVDGVTICSVIHQPRKFIFDLYDSIILLNAGGRMVYHGEVDKVQSYFNSLGHELQPGESVADWIIDISTGRSVPNKNLIDSEKRMSNTFATMRLFDATSEGGDDEAEKVRREFLHKSWVSHFKSMSPDAKTYYEPPNPYELPRAIIKPSFLLQLWMQIKRLSILSIRNLRSKLIETILLFAAAAMIAAVLGPMNFPVNSIPYVPFEYLIEDEECQTPILPGYYESAVSQSTINNITFAFCVSFIITTLVGISAARSVSEKRLEFYRESASGCSVNAYFLALNIHTFFESSIQVIIAGILVNWLWSGLSEDGITYLNFVLLTWTTVAWAMLMALIAPPQLSMLFAVFYNALACLVLTPGLMYNFKVVYDSSILAVASALFSPSRFFVETAVVSDSKCLPSQTGFTVNRTIATDFPLEKDMFSLLSLGINDPFVSDYSCSGWYWNVLPAIIAGLAVRYLGFGAINGFNRSVQSKKSLWYELRWSKLFLIIFILYWIVFFGLVAALAYTTLRKG